MRERRVVFINDIILWLNYARKHLPQPTGTNLWKDQLLYALSCALCTISSSGTLCNINCVSAKPFHMQGRRPKEHELWNPSIWVTLLIFRKWNCIYMVLQPASSSINFGQHIKPIRKGWKWGRKQCHLISPSLTPHQNPIVIIQKKCWIDMYNMYKPSWIQCYLTTRQFSFWSHVGTFFKWPSSFCVLQRGFKLYFGHFDQFS